MGDPTRHRPQLSLTLSSEVAQALDRWAGQNHMTKSRAAETLLRRVLLREHALPGLPRLPGISVVPADSWKKP